MNQIGEVQAIGGVNEKIEGFYEICKAKGLTGDQGAMIPASNVQNLMLKEEVVEAVARMASSICTRQDDRRRNRGLDRSQSRKKLPDGTFELELVNDRVDKKLREMAEKLKEFAGPEKEEKKKSEEA